MHFCETHALSEGHSALMTHSGLQFGGVPLYSCMHVHIACSLCVLQMLFGPQGEGVQGVVCNSMSVK